MKYLLGTLCVVILVLALSRCGGGDGEDDAGSEIPGGADPEAARVIDEWSTALREGDIEAAADYFEIPTLAQNGTPPLALDSREDVIAFNEALPCGAELTEAETSGRYTIATFELTERPGAGECGSGAGSTAKTAFVIEDGHITAWVRVVDSGRLPPPPDQPVV